VARGQRTGAVRQDHPFQHACYYPDPTNWHNRIKAVKEGGIAAVADTVIASWLTADFREREPQIAANMKAMLIASPVQGYHCLLRSVEHARSQRAPVAQDQKPDAGDCRASRHGDADSRPANSSAARIRGASLTIPRCRRYVPNVEQRRMLSTTP
jgi:3-oxoadipate enol-lactonase